MDDLVQWLRAQLDADEQDARYEVAAEMATDAGWTPQRVLREVEAKRRILDLHRPGSFPDCRGCGDDYPCETAKLLALPYVDRPGYQEEWRP